VRPRLLDLFCGAGGAAMGYHRAGFEVVGIDSKRQPHFPFEFHQGDALEHLESTWAETFDVIHASPPCQRYTHGNVAGDQASKHPDLVGPVRELLQATGRPYVIENVPRSPLLNPLVLCWSMFRRDGFVPDDDGTQLRMERHRLFESDLLLTAPATCHHPKAVRVAGSYGGARRDKDEARLIRKGGYVPSADVQRRLLGIDWMPESSMYLAIPPAYTEHIGAQLLGHLAADGAA
jgi:DNA (cytosine-5)-methyltransferase 1